MLELWAMYFATLMNCRMGRFEQFDREFVRCQAVKEEALACAALADVMVKFTETRMGMFESRKEVQ